MEFRKILFIYLFSEKDIEGESVNPSFISFKTDLLVSSFCFCFFFPISYCNLYFYILGLPVTLDKEGIEKLFNPYGTLKDVRIVTYRNGHSKGLAYVEYEDEVCTFFFLINNFKKKL